MVDSYAAIQYVLKQEDCTLSGVVKNLGDGAGMTRFGITSKWHPALVTQGFFDSGMDKVRALQIAVATYDDEYATPLRVSLFRSQGIATALLSICINDGLGTGIGLMQDAVGRISGTKLPPTDKMDDSTLKALNLATGTNARALMEAFRAETIAHYALCLAKRPADAADIQGWINRINNVTLLAA